MTLVGFTAYGQTTYKLVTSTSDLEAGAKYIVSNGATGSVRLLGYQANSNRPQTTSVSVSNSEIQVTAATVNTDEASAYEITLGGETGAWVLNDAVNNTILGPAPTGNNNHLKENANAKFTIAISTSNRVTMTAVAGANSNGRNIIRYNSNSGSGLFACYASGQSDIYLFKKEVTTPECEEPVIVNQPTDVTVVAPASATFTVEATGDELTYEWQGFDVGGNVWISLASFDESATTASLNIPVTFVEMNGSKLRVVISSGTCQTISDEVTLTVNSTLAVGNASATKANLVKNTVVSNTMIFAAKADVQIVNMNGQVVKTASVNENTSLDVASLANGTYIVTGNVNGKVVSQKIIKK